ncbi:MAG: hypothetical protein IJI10_12325 [Eubacterium sp.]|nr:hypothetical protein [Eubacterium sp.]
MSVHRKQIIYNIAAFILLFAASLYRQLSMRYLPDDTARYAVLYCVYVILILAWGISICLRVTQKSMRFFLLLENALIFAGLTIRFIQEQFLQNNLYLLRLTGFLVGAVCLPVVLLGFYAALGIGKADDYRIPKRWYYLILPTAILVLLLVLDDRIHFYTFIVPEEPQPNLIFHPYIGVLFLAAFGVFLIVLRVLVLSRHNSIMTGRKYLRPLVPFLESILLLIISIPYMINYLQINPPIAPPEVIEFYAKLFYIEILSWEFYIYTGLVPVNTNYYDIFEHSTLAMQIIRQDGQKILSRNASQISPDLMQQLRTEGSADVYPDQEYRLFTLPDASFIWCKDITQLQQTIDSLNQTAAELEQEGQLITEELRIRNEETRLDAQNRIYDALSGDVRDQLCAMRQMLSDPALQEDTPHLLKQLYLMGTYVKRRCNLRLIEKEYQHIDVEDFRISLENLLQAVGMSGIQTKLVWDPAADYSSAYIIYLFDMLIYLLSAAGDSAEKITLSVCPAGASVCISGSIRADMELSGFPKPPAGCEPCITYAAPGSLQVLLKLSGKAAAGGVL